MHPLDVCDTKLKHKEPLWVFAWSYLRGFFQMMWLAAHTFFGGWLLVIECFFIKNRRFENWMLRFWAQTQLWLAGVDVDVRGTENIPDEGCLFLFTHNSYIDIYVTFGYIPRPFRFGAKIELFSVPGFGPAMKAVGVLPIVRNNRDDVLKVYEAAVQRVRNGECFALAPEGTRQEQPILGKFKTGPFVFAINAQMPLVPVILTGTHLVQSKGQWMMNRGRRRRTVRLDILPPISSRGFTLEQTKDLRDKTFGIMNESYNRIQRDFLQSMEETLA